MDHTIAVGKRQGKSNKFTEITVVPVNEFHKYRRKGFEKVPQDGKEPTKADVAKKKATTKRVGSAKKKTPNKKASKAGKKTPKSKGNKEKAASAK